jgi:filamentous hemagglutinin
MRQSDIKGLTPQQIADKFALENVPTGITSIKSGRIKLLLWGQTF